MVYIAFTLGLFGSLHCLGMCGPLAFALLPGIQDHKIQSLKRALGYNVGRILSYTTLGITVGILSGFINLSGFQKPISIAMGIIFIFLFLVSMDLEKLLFKSASYRNVFSKYTAFLIFSLNRISSNNVVFMGILNGLVPCGLVYLALAGAVTAEGLLESGMFMFFFGLGTFPAMFVLLLGVSMFDLKAKLMKYRFFSLLQLFLGCFLIYRSISIDLPANLDLLWNIGKVMCH